ncbi:hypothetical protein EKO29_14940 [Colwellia sp. Arc7-635]|uniref:hypothetical protein n=1 Tax=Colwellia sp. Arc7-635 TaxID=2497879 RepID=UPI000F85387E|nr:hypothetical protein [Colwellia sp. Arc7-635]AZQ85160.1 hypothetical protein EKO29_14940 [Colwellia sp. Arc7-635]
MTTESPAVDICYLEAWLESFISTYNQSANKQLLAKICVGINAIIQHDDFDQIADRHCSYHKMKNFWQWRYQLAE